MTAAREAVGVGGAAGDLGKQLCVQLASHGFEVAAFDVRPLPDYGEIMGLDHVSTTTNQSAAVMKQGDVAQIFRPEGITHWCAPLGPLGGVALSGSELVVLHDSVMANSVRTAEQLRRESDVGIAVVHCLVNTECRVIVNDASDDLGGVLDHFDAMGLDPVVMDTESHDKLMAQTQMPLAVLCRALLPQLFEYAEDGMLTPSGRALLEALESRAAIWTNATMETVLSNPQLEWLLGLLQQVVPAAEQELV